MTVATWVEVLVDCPGAQGRFTYAVPESLTVCPGDILTVPFGAQQLGAIALHLIHQPPPDLANTPIRPVIDVSARGFFPPGYWVLLERVATYYHTPLMQVIRVALPPQLLSKSQRRVRLVPGAIASPVASPEEIQPAIATLSPTAQALYTQLQRSKGDGYTWRYLQQHIKGAHAGLRELLRRGWVESFLEVPSTCQPKLQRAVVLLAESREMPTLTARQQEVLNVLRRQGGDLWMPDLLAQSQASDSVVKALEAKGLVAIQTRERLRAETGGAIAPDQPKPLTPDQAVALEKIHSLTHPERQSSSRDQTVLLHGVTGSGKTEVYLQAIAPLLQRGQSALVLVPEIGLTPQLTDRFRQRFGDRVCVYHSGLSVGERYDTWRQMLLGYPQVVIGTRSAVFAPLPQLGLIILDEEHDSSFKQDQPMPCYHARTVAQWRAATQNCPLILGSATPAAETWWAAQVDPRIVSLSMPERIYQRPQPPVEVVDLREELHQGNRSIFSRTLQEAIADTLAKGQQGLLFIHRRGHSTFVSCRSCGEALVCPHCDVSLTYHHTHASARPILRCHYCNHVQAHPQTCPSCQSPYLKNFGSGTQRVMQTLRELFPQLRALRFDSDTTRQKGAHRRLLSQFAEGGADLLVGTQMLTKGIDLPQVTLVGIVAADGLLHQADFRAAERACQTLLQVAGRAGRGDEPGRVILQTYSPEHPVIAAVQAHRYGPFLATELSDRQALRYPPYGQLILLRLSSRDEAAVMAAADRLADHLALLLSSDCHILGPAPAPIARVAQRYRWHILLKLPTSPHTSPPTSILPDLAVLRKSCPPEVSLMVDVDPLHLG